MRTAYIGVINSLKNQLNTIESASKDMSQSEKQLPLTQSLKQLSVSEIMGVFLKKLTYFDYRQIE